MIPKCEHLREFPQKVSLANLRLFVDRNLKPAAPRCQVIGCHRWEYKNIFSKRRQNYLHGNLTESSVESLWNWLMNQIDWNDIWFFAAIRLLWQSNHSHSDSERCNSFDTRHGKHSIGFGGVAEGQWHESMNLGVNLKGILFQFFRQLVLWLAEFTNAIWQVECGWQSGH